MKYKKKLWGTVTGLVVLLIIGLIINYNTGHEDAMKRTEGNGKEIVHNIEQAKETLANINDKIKSAKNALAAVKAAAQKTDGNKAFQYVPVLMYHRFTDDESDSEHISPKRFREQLTYLKKKGYSTITLDQFLRFLSDEGNIPEKPIMITMDDSLLSQYKYAYPILQDLGMEAISFAIVHTVGGFRGGVDGTPEYTWEQAHEMEQSGVIDIESHTFQSHLRPGELPILAFPKPGETRKEYTKRIRNDLKMSKKILEKKLGKQVKALAYPYGTWNPIVKHIAKEVGFKALFSVNRGLNYRTTSPFYIKRIGVNGKWEPEELYQKIRSYEQTRKSND